MLWVQLSLHGAVHAAVPESADDEQRLLLPCLKRIVDRANVQIHASPHYPRWPDVPMGICGRTFCHSSYLRLRTENAATRDTSLADGASPS